MAITVHEFQAFPNAQNEYPWPAYKVTRLAGTTHTLDATTRAFVVTRDANGWMAFAGTNGTTISSAQAGDMPQLTAIENSYILSEPTAGRVIYFA